MLATRTWSALPAARMLSRSGFSSNVDIDAIADRLAVNSSGLDDGRNERPQTEDDALSGTQAEIVRHFREIQVKAGDRLARLNQQAAKAAEAIDIDAAASRLTDIPSRCRNEAQRIKAEFQPRIDRLIERKAQQHQYYLAYREKHHLDRIAKERYTPFVSIAVIALLITSTTMVLSGLSSYAPAVSLLPGLGWATGIGIMAIVLPFAVGANVLRFVNHNDVLMNALAWLIALLTVVGIAGMVYVSTYYLEHTATLAEWTIPGTLVAMLNDPWSPVANFSAWQRTGFVGAASLAALFVGYCADDPYPGYGEVQRAYDRANDERERLLSKLRTRINALIDAADAEAVQICERLKAAVRRLAAAVDRADRQKSRLASLESSLEDGCNIVLDRYRQANLEARTTAAPMSFSEHVCFRSGAEIDRSLRGDGRHRLEAIAERMPEFEQQVIEVRQKLRDLNSQSIYALGEIEAGEDHGE